MRINELLATIVIGLAIAGSAFASDAPTFEEADMNHDGVISKSEAAEISGIDFAAADADKDGKLSRSEYEAAVS